MLHRRIYTYGMSDGHRVTGDSAQTMCGCVWQQLVCAVCRLLLPRSAERLPHLRFVAPVAPDPLATRSRLFPTVATVSVPFGSSLFFLFVPIPAPRLFRRCSEHLRLPDRLPRDRFLF